MVDINGDGGIDGNLYRVEIQNKIVGWVSKNYSRKIKKHNQTANVQAVNPADNDQTTGKTAKKNKTVGEHRWVSFGKVWHDNAGRKKSDH